MTKGEKGMYSKTRFGIGVGFVGAGIFFMGLFGGYVAALLLVGYVLLFEGDPWLRRSAVKAVTLMVVFSLTRLIIGFIPDLVNMLYDIVAIFKGAIDLGAISHFSSLILDIIDMAQNILFLILGFKALGQKTVVIPPIEGLISKYMA